MSLISLLSHHQQLYVHDGSLCEFVFSNEVQTYQDPLRVRTTFSQIFLLCPSIAYILILYKLTLHSLKTRRQILIYFYQKLAVSF